MIVLPNLPVTEVLAALSTALEGGPNAVLVAPPGAGKTTLVPLHLLDAPFLKGAKIVLVEPRRLAARAAARRMAEILGEEVGGTVGWRMRLDTKVSARTRIEVVTEGVFTRMILGDPELAGIGLVLFDEFHERSLDADLSLALALDVQGALRADLRLVVMSATLDGARVAELMAGDKGAAPVIESRGRAFPVMLRYAERPATQTIEDATAEAVKAALSEEAGSILVFLPGQREILRVAERLASLASPTLLIAPLFGAMEGPAQDVAVRPAPRDVRKIVLATSIAETSITIDGVGTVIDSGLRRTPSFEPATGLSRLETVRVSKAGADQRAGRAGRTGPGTAIRLWREEQTLALAPFDRPEILEADLSGLVLDCAAWGVTDPRSLGFLDPPPAPALNEAKALLEALGALGPDGRLTPDGEAMRAMPLPPRLARMVVGAGTAARLAAEIAVLLTERGLGGTEIDVEERLRRFRAERSPRSKAADQLVRRIAAGAPRRAKAEAGDIAFEPGSADDVGALLALAFPDRVAVARGARGQFLLANGRGGSVDPLSTLANAAIIVVADLQGVGQGGGQGSGNGSGPVKTGRILSAARVSRETVETMFASRIVDAVTVAFDEKSGEVRARRRRRLGRAILVEAQAQVPDGSETSAALAAGLRARIAEKGLGALPLGPEGERLLLRLRFLSAAFGPPWPDLSDMALAETLEDWLMPFLPGITKLSAVSPATLQEALRGLVHADLQRRIETLAPSHFEAPTGSRLPIRYEAEGPVLAVRVQELFGLREHPALADGRLPLTLELLSPAHRPIQITRDLPGFWAGSWRDVRADLRGRYPRHSWPEDPANAAATARAKPRGT